MNPQQLLAAAFAVAVTGAGAQNLKPGLWEITQQMQAGGGQADPMAQMQKELANMPPGQRKMMEDMMAKQGVRTGRAGAAGMGVKVCMTREMVEKSELPAQQGDCRTTQQSRSGNTMKTAFACVNPPSSGESQITFKSPEAYSMKTAVSTQVGGRTEKMNMDSSGKWLAADCGNVKPMTPPKK